MHVVQLMPATCRLVTTALDHSRGRFGGLLRHDMRISSCYKLTFLKIHQGLGIPANRPAAIPLPQVTYRRLAATHVAVHERPLQGFLHST